MNRSIFYPSQREAWVHTWEPTNVSSSNWSVGFSGESLTVRPDSLLIEKITFYALTALQCGLLHPSLQHSSLARWLRLSLGPLNVCWWLCYPFRFATGASQADVDWVSGFLATSMVFKVLEWTFTSGPYHIRNLKHVNGEPVWEKETVPSQKPSSSKFCWSEFILWTGLAFTAQRGLRWSWGPTGKGNTNSFGKTLLEMARHQSIIFITFAFLVRSQDRSNYRIDPRSVLLELGVPSFPGLSLLAGCLHSTCCMFLISSAIEMMSYLLMVLTYLLYPLAQTIGLPSSLCELLNPKSYPPQFTSIFDLSSLAQFWGKTWHQKLRRPFIFCGGQPARSLARAVGASTNVQKIFGVLGAFTISGLFHEYPLYAFQRAPHPHPRVLFKTFPGSFLFFFVQSFGVILEPFIIPYIPKRLGGGRIWTASFLLLTAPMFTRDVCLPHGLLDQYQSSLQIPGFGFRYPSQ